jgi:cytochrome c biogenesis protein CcmG/thiol:disulfide interchange protein DsbE
MSDEVANPAEEPSIVDATPELPSADDATATPDVPPPSRRGAAIALIAIVVVLAGFFGYVAMAPKGKPADGTLPPDPTGYAVPDVRLPKLNTAGELGLRDLAGKVIVVNFWASWCGPCKEEAATLAAAEKKWRSQGVVFIGIDSADKNAEAKAFEKTYGIEYESIVDPSGDVGRNWGVTGYPESFFIGKDGRVVSKYISNIDAITLDQSVMAALAA